MPIESINPATGKVTEVFKEWSADETGLALEEVHAAWSGWRDTPLSERECLMRKAAEVLRSRAAEYAKLMAMEMGKPVTQGRAEAEKCAWVCDFYAENASGFLADEPAESDGSRAFTAFRPLGVILAVMPWNFPFWQVFRCAAPALMAGNSVALKHSSNVPRCALAIEDVFREAGFPENVFRTLLIGSGGVDKVIENSRVKGVAVTGSGEAGRRVAATAGRMLKKTVLELGGSDPFIVLADADLEEAARVGAMARCLNSGQSCIAAKRFIVEEPVYTRFLELFSAEMAKMVVGDPLDEANRVGPLARPDLVEELHAQVTDAVARGAEAILGGSPMESQGYYYPPTVLTGVRPGMRAYHEELFGPVAAVLAARDPDHAVTLANDTPFGLGGSVWTGDPEKGVEIAARIEAGAVFVNGMVKSDPRLPFGGIKESGYGRELSVFGIREFVNIQTIWIR
jgi:succinate-semialdehyde dehydrogenase/glutarate-semialdehyde dehydrogenase